MVLLLGTVRKSCETREMLDRRYLGILSVDNWVCGHRKRSSGFGNTLGEVDADRESGKEGTVRRVPRGGLGTTDAPLHNVGYET